MEQRRLRLGDTLDDYCPRERRVTNHAIVAMIEEDVKQTRCTTCDAEHAYKGGKLPRRRKKESPGALYKEVLAGMPEADAAPVLAAGGTAIPIDDDDDPEALAADPDEGHRAGAEPPQELAAAPEIASAEEDHGGEVAPADEGPVHRPLIRATLPRVEGHKDARPVPEFTIRQAGGRGGNGHFRGARPMRGQVGGGNGTGNRMPGGRFPGAQRAAGQGQGRGPRSDQSRGAGGGRGARQEPGRGAQGRSGAGGGFRRKRSR